MTVDRDGLRYDVGELTGWRRVVVRLLLSCVVWLCRGVARVIETPKPQPRLLDQFDLGAQRAPDRSVKTDRYEQPIDPTPAPLTALADRHAVRYVYSASRRFASSEGDGFEPMPAGSDGDPVSRPSRR